MAVQCCTVVCDDGTTLNHHRALAEPRTRNRERRRAEDERSRFRVRVYQSNGWTRIKALTGGIRPKYPYYLQCCVLWRRPHQKVKPEILMLKIKKKQRQNQNGDSGAAADENHMHFSKLKLKKYAKNVINTRNEIKKNTHILIFIECGWVNSHMESRGSPVIKSPLISYTTVNLNCGHKPHSVS